MTYWYRPDEMSLRLLYFCKLHTIRSQNISHYMEFLTDDIKISAEISRVSSVVFLPMGLTTHLVQAAFPGGNGSVLLYPFLNPY